MAVDQKWLTEGELEEAKKGKKARYEVRSEESLWTAERKSTRSVRVIGVLD